MILSSSSSSKILLGQVAARRSSKAVGSSCGRSNCNRLLLAQAIAVVGGSAGSGIINSCILVLAYE